MDKHIEHRPESKEFDINPNSTWIDPGVKELKQLKEWILTSLGWPTLTVELTDSQLNTAIANAIRLFSKYHYEPPRYLMLNLKFYKPHIGIDLTQFKVMGVKDIGFQRDNMMGYGMDMFFSPYAFFGQGGFSPFFGSGNANMVGSWVTWQNMNEFFDLSKRMMGSNPDWNYNRFTKMLTLMPEPHDIGTRDHFIIAECNCEPPLIEYYSNDTCMRLCLAEAKILLGIIRKKFSNVQLIGGGTIDTEIGAEGKEERDKIIEDIMRVESKGQSFFLS